MPEICWTIWSLKREETFLQAMHCSVSIIEFKKSLEFSIDIGPKVSLSFWVNNSHKEKETCDHFTLFFFYNYMRRENVFESRTNAFYRNKSVTYVSVICHLSYPSLPTQISRNYFMSPSYVWRIHESHWIKESHSILHTW